MRKIWFCIILGACFIFLLSVQDINAQGSEKIGNLFQNMKWRSIGPAVMGGRTVDIDVVEKQPWIIYAAIGPSGVWKSENNGTSWKPVFHKESTVSVGDIAICQTQPEIIWVGTGEGTSRNSVTIGDGIYKSTDAGKTWSNMGLKETRHISRIRIDPNNPDIVFVAALGHLWGQNEERGVYKTSDGGKNWKKILYVNQSTGIADLAMDPTDGLTLYAAAWDYQRFPFYFYSGGPGSGIYKTNDGGETWEKLVRDLPEGTKGRIGLAVARSNPNVVYALIEHKDAGIWRSEDKGETWTRTCDNDTFVKVNFRPFYYSQIRIDPTDDKVVYVFSGGSFVSKDMGEKFKGISAGTHPDHHALWIDPQNPLHLIDGNDGGIDISYNGGKSWLPVQNMALAEVYQIGYDLRTPYHVYCGLQDNGVWGGPSATLDVAGITNSDWYTIGGGDGFYCQVDPNDHNIIYANSQVNGLYRFDLSLRRSKLIKPISSLEDPPYRFNWNSPIHISPHDSKTVYTGGNFLFKTTDYGHSWDIISPDLSTNDLEKLKDSGGTITLDNTGAEVHCTILTIAESPVTPGVIWCGTDDGNVQITRNGGGTWKNIVNNIPNLPAYTWCSRIEASQFDAATAYAAFDGHRADDYQTYLYKTSDFGQTWTSIRGNLPFGWIHVIKEDPVNKNLLYVGTEFAVFASLDGGQSWFSMKNNLPTAAIRDIAVHPRENDLIIGTHGRGIWILDNISPLQQMSEEVLHKDIHLFESMPATQFYLGSSKETFTRASFSARNPAYGLKITVYLKDKPKEKLSLLIKDKAGEKIIEIKLAKKAGLQHKYWNLQFLPRTSDGKTVKGSVAGVLAPPLVKPGEYDIELVGGEKSTSITGKINPDPRFQMKEEDRAEQQTFKTKVMILSKKMGLAVTSARSLRRELVKLYKEMKKSDFPEAVKKTLKNFEEKFKPVEEEITPKSIAYRGSLEVLLRGGSLSQQIMMLAYSIGGYPGVPTETDKSQLKELAERVEFLVSKFNEFIAVDIPGLNDLLQEHDLKTVKVPKAVKL